MSRTSGSYLWQVKELLRRWKLPKIIETSPAGEEENPELPDRRYGVAEASRRQMSAWNLTSSLIAFSLLSILFL
jgi:hypothetical protein